jgi:hypothetical protein
MDPNEFHGAFVNEQAVQTALMWLRQTPWHFHDKTPRELMLLTNPEQVEKKPV